MKKVVIVLLIISIGLAVFVGFKISNKKNETNNNIGNISSQEEYYGKRGNISEEERIKFLSKNDEYLVGMMGIENSSEAKNFSNDDIVKFALNVAVERYSTMLSKNKKKTGYVVPVSTVDSIIAEYFTVDPATISASKSEFYSTSNKAYVYNNTAEKTLYYYPVSMETKEDGSKEITADAIFINDEQAAEDIEKAKYEGKYSESNVDSTIKFKTDANGKLISYQYL